MPRRSAPYNEFDDALNRLYARFQETYATETGRIAVTARTSLPSGDVACLLEGDRGASLQGFLTLLPPEVHLSIVPGPFFDVFTLSW